MTSAIWRRNSRSRPPGDVAEDPGLAGGREQQPRQHLEGGGLAGPVGAEEADHLAGRDLEGGAGDRLDQAVAAPHQPPDGRPQAGLPDRHHERLAEVVDVDVGGGHPHMIAHEGNRIAGVRRPAG
jgi:hypothetical protein